MNEAETRAEHIDPALKAAGWGVVEGSKILREYPITPGRIEGHGKRGKALTADYVLVYRNRKLAVDEAKAWDKPLTEGVGQAKDYADKMAVRFAYATNGQGIYAIDMETGKEGEIAAYPTPDELWVMTFAKADAWRDHSVGPSFGFFKFVLGGVKNLLDPPAQQIKSGNHSGPQLQLGGHELVAKPGFRIGVFDQTELLAGGKGHQPVAVDAGVDWIFGVEGPRLTVLAIHVVLHPVAAKRALRD